MTHMNIDNRLKSTQPHHTWRVYSAQLVLFWESLWPALLPILLLPVLFIAASLFDLWRFVPLWVHWLSMGAVLVGTIACAYYFLRNLVWPTRVRAIERIEKDSALHHAPIQATLDTPFDDRKNPLWERHQADMAERAKRARLKGAHATAERIDPYALRYSLLGLLVLSAISAGDNWKLRLGAALQPGTATETIASRADMWIDPPSYTGLAPIYLMRGGSQMPELASQIDVPEGSTLIGLINGKRGADISFTRADGSVSTASHFDDTQAQENKPSSGRLSLTLDESGVIQLRLAGNRGLWPVNVEADTPPIVTFIKPPEPNDKRQLSVYYTFTDDYGAASASLSYRLDPDQNRPLDAPDFDPETLNFTRTIEIEGAQGPSGERKHLINLDEDPWAGLRVLATINVTDGAGQMGTTQEVAIELPKRPFFNPLAKAVIEQRQSLAVASDAVQKVRDAFAAIIDLPREFYNDTSEYLLLQTAFWRVQRNQDETFEATVDHFWPLALELEDQALELARRRLDAAIEALRQALEQNAGETVVNQRRENLEQAIEDYIQALAQSGAVEEGGAGGEGSNQLGANQLQEMLDAIEDLSKSGANNAARQLLSDVENILDSLRLTQGGAGQGGIPNPNGDPSDGEGSGPGEQAGELIGRQRGLSDKSFEQGQQSGNSGQGGQLADEQGDIAEATRELLESLNQEEGGANGDPDPDGSAARALEDAIREMQRSQDALDGDDFDRANSAMDRAIGKLREGAQALAEAQSSQSGEGRGENGTESAEEGDNVDPLGRSTGGTGSGSVNVPDGADPARTREVIEELRRRLGEQGRSQEEIEYLERLLEAF